MRRLRTLALSLESSCDDTCFAFYKSASSALSARIYRYKHKIPLKIYGGIIPKQSSILHLNIFSQIKKFQYPPLLAFTHGPGIYECLNAADNFAKKQIFNIYHVNHVHAHVIMALPSNFQDYPFISLIISGGHTVIALCAAPGSYIIMGQTYDDSFGECYDKVLRGLFPNQDSSFHTNVRNLYMCSTQLKEYDCLYPLQGEYPPSLNFSFCGIKTHYKKLQHLKALDPPEFVKLFIDNMFEYIIQKLVKALEILKYSSLKPKSLIISGGCSANFSLKNKMESFSQELKVYLCNPRFSGDNAHMILKAAIYDIKNGTIFLTSRKPLSKWSLNELKADE